MVCWTKCGVNGAGAGCPDRAICLRTVGTKQQKPAFSRELSWWRRRESNPGPETFYRTLYVRSRRICTGWSPPVDRVLPPESRKVSPSRAWTSRLDQPTEKATTEPSGHGSVVVAGRVFKPYAARASSTLSLALVSCPFLTRPEAPRHASTASLSPSKPLRPQFSQNAPSDAACALFRGCKGQHRPPRGRVNRRRGRQRPVELPIRPIRAAQRRATAACPAAANRPTAPATA